jgi:hypothetical protein
MNIKIEKEENNKRGRSRLNNRKLGKKVMCNNYYDNIKR